MIKVIDTFLDTEGLTLHPQKDLYHSSAQVLEQVSSFCEWFAAILASIKLDIHPNVISLALLVVYQLKKSPFERKPGGEHHIVGAVLMLAERFCEIEPHTTASWAEATGISKSRLIVMKRRFHEDSDDLLGSVIGWDGDMSQFVDVLDECFNLHAEFRDPSRQSLLTRIRGWHRLYPKIGSEWYQWN
jgi:hypothetical protein